MIPMYACQCKFARSGVCHKQITALPSCHTILVYIVSLLLAATLVGAAPDLLVKARSRADCSLCYMRNPGHVHGLFPVLDLTPAYGAGRHRGQQRWQHAS